VPARVVLLEQEILAPGDHAFVQIRCEGPTAVVAGDRFVLRGFEVLGGHGRTVAGGRVLDPTAPRFRRRLRGPHLARLQALASNDPERAVAARAEDAGLGGVAESELWSAVPFAANSSRAALASLAQRGELVQLPELPKRYFAAQSLERARNSLTEALARHHASAPEEIGAAKESLRAQLFRDVEVRVFDAALDTWQRAGFVVRQGELVRLASFVPTRDDELDSALLAAFEEAGLAGFALESLDGFQGRGLVAIHAAGKRLSEQGLIVRAKPDFIVATSKLTALQQALREHFLREPLLSVLQLKELTGLSRKHLIPLAEYLDRRGWTRREGDNRVRGGTLG